MSRANDLNIKNKSKVFTSQLDIVACRRPVCEPEAGEGASVRGVLTLNGDFLQDNQKMEHLSCSGWCQVVSFCLPTTSSLVPPAESIPLWETEQSERQVDCNHPYWYTVKLMTPPPPPLQVKELSQISQSVKGRTGTQILKSSKSSPVAPYHAGPSMGWQAGRCWVRRNY